MQFVKNITASESERDDLRFLCEMAARHTKVVCVKGVEKQRLIILPMLLKWLWQTATPDVCG